MTVASSLSGWISQVGSRKSCSPSDVPDLHICSRAPAGPQGGSPPPALELPHLMRAVGLDLEEVESNNVETGREMVQTCAACPFKQTCRKDLCEGRAIRRFFLYCPNAETIQTLRGQKWFRAIAA